MQSSFADPVWFQWPVTFALLAGIAACRLLRRGAPGSAALAVATVVVPVVALTVAIPVGCADDEAVPTLRIIPLGIGLLAVIAWLAFVARLRVRMGDDRTDVDRSALLSVAALVALGVVELFTSFLSLSDYCIQGNNTARVAQLTVAGAVLTAAVLAGVVTRSAPP